MLGGIGNVFEIDETVVVQRKYNRGRSVLQQLVFAMVEVRSSKCFLFTIENTGNETLNILDSRICPPENNVNNDSAKVYNILSSLEFYH